MWWQSMVFWCTWAQWRAQSSTLPWCRSTRTCLNLSPITSYLLLITRTFWRIKSEGKAAWRVIYGMCFFAADVYIVDFQTYKNSRCKLCTCVTEHWNVAVGVWRWTAGMDQMESQLSTMDTRSLQRSSSRMWSPYWATTHLRYIMGPLVLSTPFVFL